MNTRGKPLASTCQVWQKELVFGQVSVLIKNGTIMLKRRKNTWKVKGLPVLLDKSVKTSKCEIWYKMSGRQLQKTGK